MPMIRGLGAAALLLIALGAAAPAAAYPDKPVRIVVGYAPGGGVDAVARLIADKVSPKWGKPVIVENRPGASGTIAEQEVVKGPADGHAITLVSNAYVVVPHLRKLPYTHAQLAPISQITQSPDLLIVNPAYTPVTSTKELIDLARAKPNGLNYGGSGVGSSNALSMQIFNSLLGLKMVAVQYAGTAEIVTAMLTGEINVAFGSQSGFGGQISAGKVRVLAVSSPQRLPSMPEVPTVAEAANLPGYDEGQWLGLLTTAGTPAAVVSQIRNDIVEVLKTEEAQKQLAQRGYNFVGNTPAEFAEIIGKQFARYADVLKDAAPK